MLIISHGAGDVFIMETELAVQSRYRHKPEKLRSANINPGGK